MLHYDPPYTAFADDKDMLNVFSPANRPTFITVMQQKALQLFRYAKWMEPDGLYYRCWNILRTGEQLSIEVTIKGLVGEI